MAVVKDPEDADGEESDAPPKSSEPVLKFATGVPEAITKSLVPNLIGPNIAKSLVPNLIGPNIAKSFAIPNLLGEHIAGPLSFGLDPSVVGQLNFATKILGADVASRIGASIGSSFLLPGIEPLAGVEGLWAPFFLPLQQRITESLSFLTSSLSDLGVTFRGLWPDNLDDVLSALDIDMMKKLMLEEGLPIAWVPRSAIVAAVVAADTPAKRRNVYGRNWSRIADDCAARESEMDSVAMAPYRRFLAAAITMLRDGYHEGAQALATSTIETLTLEFLSAEKKVWTGRDPLPDPESLPIQNFFIACQLWGAYRPWFPGYPAPSTYSRHASTHRVTVARQYTRTNASLAVAHLTSMMWALDTAYGRR